MQDQTHGYTDYPFLDDATKDALVANLPSLGAIPSAKETCKLAAVEPPTAVAAA
jgi:hypothetical protein